jgi:hypothetical protein
MPGVWGLAPKSQPSTPRPDEPEARYEIVHERQFDEQMARVIGSMEHGDEFIRPIEWDLARGVERGCPLAENVWRLETRDDGPEPVRIDYVRDEPTRRIHLVSITR